MIASLGIVTSRENGSMAKNAFFRLHLSFTMSIMLPFCFSPASSASSAAHGGFETPRTHHSVASKTFCRPLVMTLIQPSSTTDMPHLRPSYDGTSQRHMQ